MTGGEPTSVVTAFVVREKHVLVLKRSGAVGTYRGRWAGVSGFVETADPVDQAWIELSEELGLGDDQLTRLAAGEPFDIRDEALDRTWRVHPFRFSLAPGAEPRLDWEHVEFRWVAPSMIRTMDTVPGLWEAWCRVAPPSGSADN